MARPMITRMIQYKFETTIMDYGEDNFNKYTALNTNF